MSPNVMPDEILVARDRRGVFITWPEGPDASLTAAALRAACRCAWCTRDRILGTFAGTAPDVEIRQADALGSHGLHVRFSDGHERGIYPWVYLAELASDAASAAVASAPGRDRDLRANRERNT